MTTKGIKLFHFEGIVVEPYDKASGAGAKRLRGTPYSRLWKRLMEVLSEGGTVNYEEYYTEQKIKRNVDEFSYDTILVCRGTATL